MIKKFTTPLGVNKFSCTGAKIQSESDSLSWHFAQRLKRFFGIDIETCNQCGGLVKVIACIEDPAVIKKSLMHLDKKANKVDVALLPENRAPSQLTLFD